MSTAGSSGKYLWGIAFGVVIGLLVGGIIFLASQPPRGDAITLLPPPTALPILVHVSGAVAEPGLVSLPQGSRVADAINAAGGLLSDAEASAINLAAVLEDGQKLEVPTAQSTSVPSRALEISRIEGDATELVNINSASQDELEALPEIGPITAQAIIAHRQANGPFQTIEEIQEVEGIGPATYEKIKDLITVGDLR
ncbi:MAG: ComEA family DNA-binding protein [Anaerolineales bacterium]|nr:ComEA family DNA-binding protein [Anaerolineales bacterium]